MAIPYTHQSSGYRSFYTNEHNLQVANLEVSPTGAVETKNGSVVGKVTERLGDELVKVSVTAEIGDYLDLCSEEFFGIGSGWS